MSSNIKEEESSDKLFTLVLLLYAQLSPAATDLILFNSLFRSALSSCCRKAF